jgi:hypothetical protein
VAHSWPKRPGTDRRSHAVFLAAVDRKPASLLPFVAVVVEPRNPGSGLKSRGFGDSGRTKRKQMTPGELRSLSDDRIMVEAMHWNGIASKNARAEMDRRLIVALKESKRSTDRFGRIVVGLTLVLVVLTVVLIFRA